MNLFYLLLLLGATCLKHTEVTIKEGAPFVINGIYKYMDGDRLIWECDKNRQCIDVIIRDARLAKSAVKLNNQRLTLRVRRIVACGPQSSQVACLRSRDGTALLIEEWM